MSPSIPSSPRKGAPNHTRSHTRDRSFSIEQFTDLISTALDIHRVPDVSFSPILPSYQRPHNSPRRTRKVLRKFRSAFFRKDAHAQVHDALPPTLNATRRLASSSVPALCLPPVPVASGSDSTLELDLPFGESFTEPPTPADSAFVATPEINVSRICPGIAHIVTLSI